MLNEPTVTKLLAMKLNGMVEALEEQRKSAQTASLSFEKTSRSKSACRARKSASGSRPSA